MEIGEKLKRAGLTTNESKVYLELLKRGPINASQLSKQIGFDRTFTYQLLNNLLEKGLVNYIIKENKKSFSAANPDNLLEKAKEQEHFISKLVVELKKVGKSTEEFQKVEVYEGKAGLKALFNEIYKTNNLCFFGATGASYDVLKFEIPRIAKEMVKRGIHGRGIADDKIKGQPFTKIKNLEMRYLKNVESYNTATTITSDGRVSIHCLAQEKPFIIIIV